MSVKEGVWDRVRAGINWQSGYVFYPLEGKWGLPLLLSVGEAPMTIKGFFPGLGLLGGYVR